MRRYKISQSVVPTQPGWYAMYYANGNWHEVTYSNKTKEPIRFVHAKDATNAARTWAEAHKCTTA